jgi:hypothetical protein
VSAACLRGPGGLQPNTRVWSGYVDLMQSSRLLDRGRENPAGLPRGRVLRASARSGGITGPSRHALELARDRQVAPRETPDS